MADRKVTFRQVLAAATSAEVIDQKGVFELGYEHGEDEEAAVHAILEIIHNNRHCAPPEIREAQRQVVFLTDDYFATRRKLADRMAKLEGAFQYCQGEKIER